MPAGSWRMALKGPNMAIVTRMSGPSRMGRPTHDELLHLHLASRRRVALIGDDGAIRPAERPPAGQGARVDIPDLVQSHVRHGIARVAQEDEGIPRDWPHDDVATATPDGLALGARRLAGPPHPLPVPRRPARTALGCAGMPG